MHVLPPEINQFFNIRLLSTPCTLGDDSRILEKFNDYILILLEKKSRSGKIPSKYEKTINSLKEFKELYESIKVKEKELEAKKGHKLPMPFYFIGSIDKESEKIYGRVRSRFAYSFNKTKRWRIKVY